MLLHLAVLTTANVVEPEPGFVSEFSAPASRKSLKNTRETQPSLPFQYYFLEDYTFYEAL